ncbi:KinB-signaling pathway activation protein [Alkalihalobacillus hwajinpoensis]|uniref:KinB-signaling pathway activation protein n=1 Tax=Guptibacillus hwajinpoensis TaxID=208199 RepID=UPI00188328A0|nr:KinB-signaling pathway activation protein [Pseudalkalibacillus hwajinpoensis]MBF0707228.1 KinB-signaling pathway activation protein [Pseudalkalibacillus hwajinpoensis]
MKTRNLVYLFFTTLLIGSTAGMLTGIVLDWSQYWTDLKNGEFVSFLIVILWLLGVSSIFSLISQMGFFAYLTIHRFGLGIFKSVKLWNTVQVVLIAVALFDLVYFRYAVFAEKGESILSYILTALFILIIGLVTAYIKQKETNKQAFIPALFFIVVVTILEWIPGLQSNDPKWLWLILVPLLVSNVWQLLSLHRLIRKEA